MSNGFFLNFITICKASTIHHVTFIVCFWCVKNGCQLILFGFLNWKCRGMTIFCKKKSAENINLFINIILKYSNEQKDS